MTIEKHLSQRTLFSEQEIRELKESFDLPDAELKEVIRLAALYDHSLQGMHELLTEFFSTWPIKKFARPSLLPFFKTLKSAPSSDLTPMDSPSLHKQT